MPHFYIFYSGSNDPRNKVRLYHRTARKAGKEAGIRLSIEKVNIIKEIDDILKKYFGGTTIECVTVVNNVKRDSEVNPNKARIVEMVMDLKGES